VRAELDPSQSHTREVLEGDRSILPRPRLTKLTRPFEANERDKGGTEPGYQPGITAEPKPDDMGGSTGASWRSTVYHQLFYLFRRLLIIRENAGDLDAEPAAREREPDVCSERVPDHEQLLLTVRVPRLRLA
jgi:hypothetical protein